MNERHFRVCAWGHASLRQHDPWMVLGTETTELGASDEAIEVAIVNGASGAVLYSSLIQPHDPQRPDLATPLHGIAQELLAGAPTFPHIWPAIEEMLSRYRQVLVYHAAPDKHVLEVTARSYGYHLPSGSWSCLREQYAEYHGEGNDDHQRSIRR